MKKFHIAIDGKQIGPLSIDDLKTYNLSPSTKIWYEGLESWVNISDVEELKSLVNSSPPPLPPFLNQANRSEVIKPTYEAVEEAEKYIYGIKVNHFIAVCILLFSAIVLFYLYNTNQNNKNRILEQESTSKNLEKQVEEQKLSLENQNKKIQKQEKIENERKKEEFINKAILENEALEKELNGYYVDLENAKKELIDVSTFKLLRSSSQKAQEILDAQHNIDMINEKINYTQSELMKAKTRLDNALSDK